MFFPCNNNFDKKYLYLLALVKLKQPNGMNAPVCLPGPDFQDTLLPSKIGKCFDTNLQYSVINVSGII